MKYEYHDLFQQIIEKSLRLLKRIEGDPQYFLKLIEPWFDLLDFSDQSSTKRLQFFLQQYIEALSPQNFIEKHTDFLTETLQNQGVNLLRGLDNLLNDLLNGSLTMTDTHAFCVGETVATTPGNVIYRNDLIELIQYSPQTPKVKSVPLLIIPPWINKYYILDLSPRNSFVRWIVEQGITVFIISWINPDERHAQKGLENYLLEGPVAAIQMIQMQLQVKQVNALGFCIGGTLLSMLLAYYKAKVDDSIRSATFLASMIDFSDPGDISIYIDEYQIAKVEQRMQKIGYLEGYWMAQAFNSLRARDLIWAFFIRNYLHGKPPKPFDLLFWNADTTNMPYKMHSDYLRWMYLNNDLIKPNQLSINGVTLDIHHITTPTFFISTEKDHIAPWKTTYLGFRLMRGKKCFILGGSGHIAGIVIPPGSDKYGYYLNSKSPKNPQDWLKNAVHHNGSWWPEWMMWLKNKSGRLVVAPKMDACPMRALTSAPGEYVYEFRTRETRI